MAVAQPEFRGPRRSTAKRLYLPWISTNGSLQLQERYHNTDGSVAVGMSSLNTGRMEILKGTFFDPLRVCPIGPTWRGYLVLSFRGYQRFYQWLQPSYPPLMSLLHAILELLSYLSWLSGGNTASQTPRTIGIYGPRFRNYRLDCHETWQKWSRDVNSEV